MLRRNRATPIARSKPERSNRSSRIIAAGLGSPGSRFRAPKLIQIIDPSAYLYGQLSHDGRARSTPFTILFLCFWDELSGRRRRKSKSENGQRPLFGLFFYRLYIFLFYGGCILYMRACLFALPAPEKRQNAL